MLFFLNFYSIKYPEKGIIISTIMLTGFSIDNNNKCYLEHQINLLKSFLKDHMTLKTGLMVVESSALPLNK